MKIRVFFYFFVIAILNVLQLKATAYNKPDKQEVYVAKVSELYEFHGIVWHLVGDNTGFTNTSIPEYMASVDSFFHDYRNHKLIEFCRELSDHNQVAFSAVTQAASHTEIFDGGIRIKDGFNPDSIVNFDYRWSPENFCRYVSLADSFYRETDFHDFFQLQGYLYSEAERWFYTIIGKYLPDGDWFENHFGRKHERCFINLGLINSANYAIIDCDLADKNEVAMLFGCAWTYDSRPDFYYPVFYHHGTALVVLHEIMHSYINPLVDEHKALFDSAVGRIYPHVSLRLVYSNNGDPEAITKEGFTRLFTLYAASEFGYQHEFLDTQLSSDSAIGLPWQRNALSFLDNFNNNRDKYPNIGDFMPELAHFLDTVADNLHHYTRVNFGHPTVMRVSPDTNAVYHYCDIDTFEIEVEFSDDMKYCIAFGLVGEENDSITNSFLHKEINKHGYSWMFVKLNPWINLRTMQIRLPKQLLIESRATGVRITRAYTNGLDMPLEHEVILKYKFVE